MTGALAGEWTKLSTIRSPRWTAAAALLALAGIGAAKTAFATEQLRPSGVLEGSGLGMLLVMALAAVATTGDHSTGTHRLSVMAEPRRIRLFAAKTAVVAAVCGLTAALGSAILALVGLTSSHIADDWTGDDARTLLMTVPSWMLAGVVAVAVGTLLRRTALTVTLLMVWPLAIEPLVVLVPKVGKDIVEWLPFHNLAYLVTPAGGAPHGTAASLLVGLATAAVLSALALAVERRRSV